MKIEIMIVKVESKEKQVWYDKEGEIRRKMQKA